MVSQVALAIPIYCDSIAVAAHTAKKHLEDVLAFKEMVYSMPSYTSAGTGSTIPATQTTPSTQVVPPAYTIRPTFDISGKINDFFGNIVSLFDYFSQVINLVYINPPLEEKRVQFDRIVNAMQCAGCQNEPLTQYVTTLQGSQWYLDLVPFRHCKTHRKIIQFDVLLRQASIQTSPWPSITTILLPDDPYSNRPTYNTQREMQIFGVDIFKNSLSGMDHMFSLLETKVTASGHIPI